MLTAKKAGVFNRNYEVQRDGTTLTEWHPQMFSNKSRFDFGGTTYELGSNFLGGRWGMADADGELVASALRSKSTRWTVEADGREYDLETDFWGRATKVTADGQPVGAVRRTGLGSFSAELDGVPEPTQLFLLLLAVARTDRRRRGAMAGAAGAGGAAGS